MSKKTFVEFTCDNCSKQQASENNFPYEKEWIYIYNISGKKDNERAYTHKDLHFCSKACFFDWILKRFMAEEDDPLTKAGKKVSEALE